MMTQSKRWLFGFFLQIFFLLGVLANEGQAEKAKLAILINDVGYKQDDSRIFSLPTEIAIAITPVAPYASYRARQANDQKRDVLIYLPMQSSLQEQNAGSGILKIGMNESEITQLLRFVRNIIPNASGVNNYLGDAATEDSNTMRNLMKVLIQQQLAFLDNRTSLHSVAYRTATEFGVRSLARDLFLDENSSYAQLKEQFISGLNLARSQGFVVLTAQSSDKILTFLEKEIIQLPKDIKLISLNQLWHASANVGASHFHYSKFDIYPAPTSQAPFHYVPLLRGIPK